jgi:hypothetical protein
MAATTIIALPDSVRALLVDALEALCDGGIRTLVMRGQFEAGDVNVAEERLREHGTAFVPPPTSATVYAYQTDRGIDVEVPLWTDGATEASDLFAYFSIRPDDSRVFLTDLRTP